ncbi:MAG: hypothetical protein FIA91_04105 [Geobacter sp.]|nr:hypothetical protein [Geobacter sp.]
MTLKQHLQATGAAVAVMAPFCNSHEIALFSVGSILIDVDHQIFYIVRTGRYDVSGMFRYFREDVDKHLQQIPYLGICIFHTVEFLLLVSVLAVFYQPLRWLLAGLILHLSLDIFDLIRLKVPFIRAYSIIEHLIRRRQRGYPFV